MSGANLPQETQVSGLNLPQEAEEQLAPGAAEAGAVAGCACTLFAVVNDNGTLARGFGAVSATRFQPGRYAVTFDRNVSNCAYVAAIGLSGSVGFSLPGEITVAGQFNNVNGVFITTNASGGADVDRGFQLAVHCRP